MALDRYEIVGDITLSSGPGAPTHAAPPGSQHEDTASGVSYRRTRVDAATLAWTAHGAAGTPAHPVDGQYWIELAGTSPARTASLVVQDGEDVITLLQVTY